jgi:hypothetical protein
MNQDNTVGLSGRFLPHDSKPVAAGVYCPACHGTVAVPEAGCKARRQLNLVDPSPLRCIGPSCPRYDSLTPPIGSRTSKSGRVYLPIFKDGRLVGGTMLVRCKGCGEWKPGPSPWHRLCKKQKGGQK